MRILFLTPYVPSPIRVRPYNLLRALAKRGHTITLLCVVQGEGLWARRPAPLETAALEELATLGIETHCTVLPRIRSLLNCLPALPTGTPLQAVYCWSPALARLLRQTLAGRPHDLLHIEHLRGARYGLWLRAQAPHLAVPVVWDSVDCISHLFAQSAQRSRSAFGRLVTRLELPRTRRYEALLRRRFERTLVTSPVDAQAMVSLTPTVEPPPLVLPNGVDLEYFRPDDTPRRPAELVFSGKMSYHANISAVRFFLQEVLPLVQRERPEVYLTVVGSDPPATLQAQAGPHLTVTGYLPDIRPYLRRATLAVAPMPYGAGIQNKVLEAMACATPVVATPQAVSAIQARPGEEVLVAQDAAGLAAQILRLLQDSDLRERLGRAGRTYVERHHDWGQIAAHLEQIYTRTCNRFGKTTVPVYHRKRF